ncbi:MAG: hypothetical protein AAF192_08235 [Pseudomonadota bacterium]
MTEIRVPARACRAGAISAARAPADGEEDTREVALSFSSDAEVERYYGFEVLGHGPAEVDLTRLNGGAPLLTDHRASLDSQIGRVVSAEIGSDGRGRAVVRFGKSERASEMLARVRDGEIAAVSVGSHRVAR